MSAAEAVSVAAPRSRPRRAMSTRFFRSELMLIFGRRRNWAGMAVLAAVPVLITVVIKIRSAPRPGDGPDFFSSITQNGLFAGLAALTVELPLFLPIAVGSIAGDSIAGEANSGTLRYLLAVPVHRARLVAVKYAGVVVFTAAAVLLVAGVGAVLGLILFGGGPMTTLSGTEFSFATGAWRLLLICGYMTVCLSALAAIGLFVSTLTEQPLGATIAVLVVAVASEICDLIPQLASIAPYLPTHYWLGFGDLLRDPIAFSTVGHGLFSAGAYIAVFWTLAWARFGTRDVSC